MTVDQLRCFLAVAKQGNFTKAAETLYISHSAVSKIISSLEDDLKAQLFKRDNRSVSLTPAGKVLLEKGSHIAMLWEDLESCVVEAGRGLLGTLSVYTPHLYHSGVFHMFHEMRSRYPHIDLLVHQSNPIVIYDAVKMGHVDVGITFSFAIPEDESDYASLSLFTDKFYAVVSAKSPLAAKSIVSMADLASECMVYPAKIAKEVHDLELLRKITRPITSKEYFAESIEDVFFQIKLGRGIAILPSMTVKEHESDYKLLPIWEIPETFTLDVIWKEKPANPSLKYFIEVANSLADYREEPASHHRA